MNILEAPITALKSRCKFLESRWCNVIIGFVLFLNPIAIVPQLYKSLFVPAEQLAGVSVFTFVLFGTIQFVLALNSVKTEDRKVFWSMSLSLVLTIATVITTLVRA